jgi:pimeloyl-ACP methyl ester carboxylesterase
MDKSKHHYLPVGAKSMPSITLGQLSTAYDSFGQGPRSIVMVQGLGLDRHTWGQFGQLLALRHRVVTFDARGAGDARDAGAPFSTLDMARDVIALCHALEIERPVLLGFSLGGCVAQHVAALAPQLLSGLVLLSCVARPSARSAELLAVWRDMVEGAVDRAMLLRHQLLWASEDAVFTQQGALQATIDYVMALPQTQPASGFIRQANACIAHDARLVCRAISTPTAVILGAHERVFSVPEVQALAQLIPGASYQCLGMGGHNMWLEYPAEVAQAVSSFVASLA